MDLTVEYLWSRECGVPVAAADWAIQMLQSGVECDALLRLTDRNLEWSEQSRLLHRALHSIGRQKLLDPATLKTAYEAESISDYFDGRIDGWTLIDRCVGLWGEEDDEEGYKFWMALGDDADQHGGQGICLTYDFVGKEFDQVLNEALRQSNRPLPKDIE